MNSTTARRALLAIRESDDDHLDGDDIMQRLPEPRPSDAALRAAVQFLDSLGAVKYKPFAVDATIYMVSRGDKFDLIEQSLNRSGHIAQEILQLILRKQRTPADNHLSLEEIRAEFPELGINTLHRACITIRAEEWGRVSESDTGDIHGVQILDRGYRVAEGDFGNPPSRTSTINYHGQVTTYQGVINSNISHSSSSVSQSVSAGKNREILLRKIIEAIHDIRANRLEPGFDGEGTAKFLQCLDEAVLELEREEPEPEAAEGKLKKAVRVARGMLEDTTKIATAIAPVVDQLGEYSGRG